MTHGLSGARGRSPRTRALRLAALALLAPTTVALSGCSRGMLDPHSSDAVRVAHLWWVSFGIATALFIVIMAIFSYALFHRRDDGPAGFDRSPGRAHGFVLVAGAIIPIFILVGVFAYSVQITAANTATHPDALRIEVIGHDWWWEFRYTDQSFRTVNSLHIPVDRPVDLTLTADDVIHSFWVPQLNGKTDAIPGILNHMTLSASSPGSYRGVCAEYCGVGHACMPFEVVADEKQDFDAWTAKVKSLGYHQPGEAGVQYMLNACVNENRAPVCMPAGCPQPLPPVGGPTPAIPQFEGGAGSPSG